MTQPEIQLDLFIEDKEADPDQLDELTVRLMRDLRELGAESVERPAGEDLPIGAKGDPVTIGALALVAVPAVLPSLVNFLQGWSLRGESRKVRIKTPAGLEIEFTPDKKMSHQDVLALVEQLTASTEDAGGDKEPSSLTLSYRTQLRQLLSKHFDKGELQTLCFDLGVDYDGLPGEGKADKERELIKYLERRGRVWELVELGKRLRPDVPWESDQVLSSAVTEKTTLILTPRVEGEIILPEPPVRDKDTVTWSKDGKEMVHVPAGVFLYGDDKQKVELPEFWIDKTPVTNSEYAHFVADTGRRVPHYWEGKTPPQKIVDNPVIYVTWHDAVAYAEWAGKRLPTEMEWEKAARGTDGRTYPWGNEEPTPKLCNFDKNRGGTTPVGQYSPQGDSPYGCVDMAGNVWEWTTSEWERGSEYRVLRGGAWVSYAGLVRSAYRGRHSPDLTSFDFGFRCVDAFTLSR